MRPRELGGLTRNPDVKYFYVWVQINKFGGDWLEIPKSMVRDIVNMAKGDPEGDHGEFDVIRAERDGDEVYIGGPEEIAMEAEAVDPYEGEVEGGDEEAVLDGAEDP